MSSKKIAYCGLLTTVALLLSYVERMLSALLFTGFASFLYSASGALLSFTVMAFCKKTNIFSMIAVSILGGISHNIGQITIACVIVENIGLFYYMPFLIILGIATGFITGIVGNKAVYYIKNNKH